MSNEAEQRLGKAEANALADRFKAGDAKAFDALVRAFQKPIFNLSYRMLSNYEDASDATQETFVKVHRSIARFRGDASFSTWLFTVAANTCRNQLRSRVRRSNFEVGAADRPASEEDDYSAPQAVESGAAPDLEMEQKDIIRHVEKVVASIPEDYRAVLIMRDMQDMTYEDIAESLDCSMGTIKSRLSRARMMVREKLAPTMSEL